MKIAMTLSMVALLATTGAASAGEPMVLTDAQMDRVTAGSAIKLTLPKHNIVAPSAVEGSIEVKTELGKILIGLILPTGTQLTLPAVQMK
jgi:hypothetical protein